MGKLWGTRLPVGGRRPEVVPKVGRVLNPAERDEKRDTPILLPRSRVSGRLRLLRNADLLKNEAFETASGHLPATIVGTDREELFFDDPFGVTNAGEHEWISLVCQVTVDDFATLRWIDRGQGDNRETSRIAVL